MNYELPPMPEPGHTTPVQFGCDGRWHSDEAMRAYALAVARDVMRMSAEVEREACAAVAEALIDKKELARARKVWDEAEAVGASEEEQVARGKYWMTVSTYNAGLSRAAEAIRARGNA